MGYLTVAEGVDRNNASLHNALGVSDERMDEIMKATGDAVDAQIAEHPEENSFDIPQLINAVEPMLTNDNERTVLIFTIGKNVGFDHGVKSGRNSVMQNIMEAQMQQVPPPQTQNGAELPQGTTMEPTPTQEG